MNTSKAKIKSLYSRTKWKEFSQSIIEADGYQCTKCHRTKEDGVTLQAHHKDYIKDRKPWEYSFDDMITLCSGCHGREHGILQPTEGWEFLHDEDLGDRCGICDLCGTEIRYVFTVYHENWHVMEVGTNCCDLLTNTDVASRSRRAANLKKNRLHHFLKSPKWEENKGVHSITRDGFLVTIHPINQSASYHLNIGTAKGTYEYPSLDAAKLRCFEFIDSGDAKKIFTAHPECKKR